MTKYIIALFAAFAFATSAYAAPATVTLPAKNGNVIFPHAKHVAAHISCKRCHEGAPGKIEGFDKAKAHALCIGCHKATSGHTGPTNKCGECHHRA